MAGPGEREPLAVLLLGPTGSGKTTLALALGGEFRGEVVSCDSVAVYRGMDIGSAKPSVAERSQLPHHLIDVAEPNEEFSAGEYSRLARAELRGIALRGGLPLVTGGTGLYLRALTMGLFAGPERRPELRARLLSSQEKHGGVWLWRVLERMDGKAAERIHGKDIPKLIRAIEVCVSAGRPMSELLASGRDALTGFRLLRIGLAPPREALYARLNARAEKMFRDGLVEETRGLLARFGEVRSLETLGYRQAASVVRGERTLEEAIVAAQQGHRNYAKRQWTWFRREPDVHWIEGFGEAGETIARARELVIRSLDCLDGCVPR